MTRKSFRTATSKETVEFDIDGEVFHCHKQISAGVLLQFADMSSDTEDGSGREAIHAIQTFFNAAIVAEDRDRFNALLSDPDRFIDINLLLEIANWLGEQFTARPTGAPSALTSSETDSGAGSTAGALPVGTTFSRKETPAEV